MSGWAEVANALGGILERQRYTDHGPLLQRLEAECADAAGARHGIAVANPTIGLLMLTNGLALSGAVVLSALAPARCAQALEWAGASPRFCDIDTATLGVRPAAVAAAFAAGASALLSVIAADQAALPAAHGLPRYHDGLHPSGSYDDGSRLWRRFRRDRAPRAAGPALVDLAGCGDDAGAACLLTDDDALAARLRCIRGGFGDRSAASGVCTANGPMSEVQAAMALLVPAARRMAARHAGLIRGRSAVPHGRDWLLLPRDAADRAALVADLDRAGVCVAPFQLDPRAQHCAAASKIAEHAVILRASDAATSMLD